MSLLKLHPEYKPFVGEYYNDSQKTPIKILFIGESHYLPPQYKIDYSEWYNRDTEWFKKEYKIEEKHLSWINTSKIIEEDVIKGIPAKAHFIYTQIADIYGYIFLDNKCYKEALKHIAFVNYFIRPKKKNKDNFSDEDKEKAFINLKEVVNEIKPDKVIFINKESYTSYGESMKKSFDKNLDSRVVKNYTPHPSTEKWEMKCREYGNISGKEKLIEMLNEIKEEFKTIKN
jgi:hypothetical protein